MYLMISRCLVVLLLSFFYMSSFDTSHLTSRRVEYCMYVVCACVELHVMYICVCVYDMHGLSKCAYVLLVIQDR